MRKCVYRCVMVSVMALPLMWGQAAARSLISESPIEIDADHLEVLQKESRAIFKGNVAARQGEMTLLSDVMTVHYGDAAPGASTSSMGALRRIEAQGNVRLNTPGESGRGSKGVYDAEHDKVYLFGDVVLRRGENVLNGSRLEYNVNSGASLLSGGASVRGAPSDARVRGVFVPSKEGDASSAGASQ